jgi:hypothetical protein
MVSIPLMVVTCTCYATTCVITAIRREPLTLRYLNTCQSPFKERAEEWVHEREVSSSCTKEKDFRSGSI